jgi:hypothetical protein
MKKLHFLHSGLNVYNESDESIASKQANGSGCRRI